MFIFFSKHALKGRVSYLSFQQNLPMSISCLSFRQGLIVKHKFVSCIGVCFSFFATFVHFRRLFLSNIVHLAGVHIHQSDAFAMITINCFSALFSTILVKFSNSFLLFKTPGNLFFFSSLLKNSSLFLFSALLDIFMADMITSLKNARFFLFYCFLNVLQSRRIFLQFCCTEFSSIFSLTSLFYSAN